MQNDNKIPGQPVCGDSDCNSCERWPVASSPAMNAASPTDDLMPAFEAWAKDPTRAEKLPLEQHQNGAYKNTNSYLVCYGWKSGYRAALAAPVGQGSPTEADKMLAMRAEYDRQHAAKRGTLAGQGIATSGEALPSLPQMFGIIDVYDDTGAYVKCVDGFTADQMRGYAIDYGFQLGRAALAEKAEQSNSAGSAHQHRLARIRDYGDQGLIASVRDGSVSISEAVARITAPVAERAAAPASVPGGWKLVPRKLTEEMHVAAVRAILRSTGNDDFPPSVWSAMLAAAPEVAQPAAQGERAREPLMADGVTPLSDYLENTMLDAEIGDEWTKGYEECKRRLFGIVGHQLRATPAPTAGEPSAPISWSEFEKLLDAYAWQCEAAERGGAALDEAL